MRTPTRATGIRLDSPWRIALAALTTAVSIVAVGLLLALVVVPLAAGGRALVVLTGSMEPNLSPGDVAVTRGVDPETACSTISAGQIVSYFPKPNNPELITHRVIGKNVGNFSDGTNCRFIVRGDANTATDEPVSPKQLRGVFMFGVPKVGWLLNAAQNNRTATVTVVAAIFLGFALWSVIRPPKRRIVTTTTTLAPPTATPERELELELRARELDLRERELALREAERRHL